MGVKKIIKFIWEYFKVNLQSAMEYRISFLSQVGFMFLNDIVWLIFWFLFFAKFPAINNWEFVDMMFMYAIITTSWGMTGVIFGNFTKIANVIREGQLDFYLTLPKEELTHLLISKAKFSALGDVLFGIIMSLIFVPLSKFPLLIILIILSMMVIIGFAVLLGALTFYIGSSTEVSRQGLMGALSIASYPFSVFDNYTKFILLTVFPAGFISGVPAELLKQFNWQWFGLTALAAVIILAIAIIVFKLGVRKYESGNTLTMRG